MGMTYSDLARIISKMTPEQLNQNVTLYTNREFYPAELCYSDEMNDVLDANHPYFKIEWEK